jgi:outer membrane receptor for ferrienterochelin and colicin
VRTILLAVALAALLVPAVPAAAQKTLDEMTLEELLDVKVSVASNKEQTPRSSPGIVTVITAEEIADSGARDLSDILLLVPGFTFGVDVLGVTSIGIRGNWAQEGKALLLWDGQEINEGYYGNLALDNHFPVDQIKKIEIIRGLGRRRPPRYEGAASLLAHVGRVRTAEPQPIHRRAF